MPEGPLDCRSSIVSSLLDLVEEIVLVAAYYFGLENTAFIS